MHRHSIDPLSAALGLMAGAVGVIVAVGRADSFIDDAAWWIALVALLLGIGLVPWNGRSRRFASAEASASTDHEPTVDQQGVDESMSSAERFDILQLPPADGRR